MIELEVVEQVDLELHFQEEHKFQYNDHIQLQ
jgi:hypothetical protein